MPDFSVSVKNAIEKALDKAETAFRGIALEVVSEIQDKTPVRTGFLRANFSAVTSEDAIPKPGSPVIDGAARATLDDTIYIVNPVPYARRVEYGFHGVDAAGRAYNHQGRGMVQQTIAELPEITSRVVEEIADEFGNDQGGN